MPQEAASRDRLLTERLQTPRIAIKLRELRRAEISWLAFHFSSHVRLLLLTGFGHGHALLRWRLASLPLHSSATQKPFFTSLNSKSDLTQVFVSCLLARIRLAGTEQSCPGLSGSTLALVLRPLSGCAEWREPVLWVFHLS